MFVVCLVVFVSYVVYSVFLYCFCIVFYIVSPFVHSCFFPIFVQVYRPLPKGGNTNADNKYHIISYIPYRHIISYHIISYHIISYHIISYHIISYHIISYHIIAQLCSLRGLQYDSKS